jgi:Carboxypeptidase regulatory-like domain/TonB dependent receptor
MRQLLLALATVAMVSLPAFSQGSQGAIQGGVFDSGGGTIPGAKVTVTDVARGTSRTLTTDEAGQYIAPALTAGTYTVRAEIAGFSTVERTNVLLEVGQNIRVDLTLSPGAQSETVTVTEEVAAIDTTSATLGGTISNQAIVALPLNGRNFLRLLELRPGVVSRPGDGSGSTSTNGRRLGADVLLVEGITQFEMATSGTLINGTGKGGFADAANELPLDAIQEFNTQQNAPAEYGWRDGSVVNVGIKSGTNSLHGTAYVFGRNAKATDAANYFTHRVNPATMEQFGATAGGRIKKDKAFWFVSYEGLRLNTTNTGETRVPSSIGLTPANPNASIVDACNAVKAGGGTISPLSAQLAGLNAATCVVSPATADFQNEFYYNPTSQISYFFGTPSSQPLNNGLAKGDWNINERHHVSGFYYDSRSEAVVGGTIKPYWDTRTSTKTQEIALAWTWTRSSTWVNDFRAGFAGTVGDVQNGDVHRFPADPYPTGYSLNTGVNNREFGSFPTITFATSNVVQLGIGGRSGRRGPQGQFNYKDTVSYLRGGHAFKFGGEMVRVKFRNKSTQNTMGTIAFDTLTNFLAGTPVQGSSSIIIGNPEDNFRSKWFAGFIQDTWRITPTITVTPGVRYEYQGPPHDVHNYLGTFDASVPGGVAQVGPGLPHSKLYNPEKADFSPRFGIAWDIRGKSKTVLRGGVSRMSSFPSITSVALSTQFGATLFGPGNTIVVDRRGTDLSQHFASTLTNVPLSWNTTGPIFPIASASPQCTVAIPCATGALDPNFKRPKSIQWNVDIQRAITSLLTLDVAYVGNHGYDETYSQDINTVPVGTAYTPAVIAACLASDAGCTSAATRNLMAAAITAARPYNAQFPYYNYIVRTTSGFHSNYNALQVTVDQREFHGVRFLAAYTWSHSLDMWTKSSANTQQVADPVHAFSAQYGNSDQDVRHRFRFSPSWTLPRIKTPGQMLEGWTISGVLSLQGRFPWAAIDKARTDWVGTGENSNTYSPNPNDGVQQYWNYTGPTDAFNVSTSAKIPCYGSVSGCTALAAAPPDILAACTTAAQAPYSGNPTQMALALRALNNNACYIQNGGILTPPAYGTNGNSGRNSFRGPQFKSVDMTVSKRWHVGERYRAEFRAEFFNLFNTPALGSPNVSGVAPSAANFGLVTSTADGNNNIFGSGGPRHIQFGLKFAF